MVLSVAVMWKATHWFNVATMSLGEGDVASKELGVAGVSNEHGVPGVIPPGVPGALEYGDGWR
jgi:hypothetical protein